MIKKLFFIAAFGGLLMVQAQDAQEVTPAKTPKFSIIPSVGYAWRTAKTPDGIPQNQKDYIKGIKSGVNFDISAYYNVKNNWALGLKFSRFSASTEGNLTVANPNNGSSITAFASTKDHITFFGPAFMYNNFNEDTKHKLFYDFSVGYISYTTTTGNVKGKGGNAGFDLNIAYQYAINNQIFVGPKLGYTVGTLSEMKFNGQSMDLSENKEGLGRVNLNLAATFRF